MHRCSGKAHMLWKSKQNSWVCWELSTWYRPPASACVAIRKEELPGCSINSPSNSKSYHMGSMKYRNKNDLGTYGLGQLRGNVASEFHRRRRIWEWEMSSKKGVLPSDESTPSCMFKGSSRGQEPNSHIGKLASATEVCQRVQPHPNLPSWFNGPRLWFPKMQLWLFINPSLSHKALGSLVCVRSVAVLSSCQRSWPGR